ncbi:MAG: SMI1/KNR4 family protein [Chitinophagaceae bacterium]
MKKYWQEIEGWILANGPPMMGTLNGPATAGDLKMLEAKLDQQLPQDFKDFLSVHNGQKGRSLALFDRDTMSNLEEIGIVWEFCNEMLPSLDDYCQRSFGVKMSSTPDAGINDHWWSASWIPITSDGAGNHICIDLDPAEGGTKGQIIRMWHDDPGRALLAPSFSEWIGNYVADLKNGKYQFEDDGSIGGIVKVADVD